VTLPARSILLVGGGAPLLRRVAAMAHDLGLSVTDEVDHPPPPELLAAVVVDLALPRSLEEVASWRERVPAALLVAHLRVPDRELWQEAERLGCDLVTNEGALAGRLRRLLSAGPLGRRLFPLLDAADVAGRLGLVCRVETTPVGPVALYQVGGRLSCVGDVCPHQGATLSLGELDGAVVTCPAHGSRFDVATGERLRGPADSELQLFDVAEVEGRIQLVVP
jgi:nitrite reductase/ring-hydroxylating ferredoxin subunit